MANKLNPKQKKFVEMYIRHRNATTAAIEAGYSEKTARNQGSRLLANDNIKSELKRRLNISQKQLQNNTNLTKEQLIAELLPAIFSDLGDVADWDKRSMELIPKSALNEAARKSIESLVYTETATQNGISRRIQIKQRPKEKAIELAAKLLGYIAQKHELTGKDGEPLTSPMDEQLVREVLTEIIARKGKKFE